MSGWDRLSMSKMLILNLSLRTVHITEYYHHERVFVTTDEIRKSQEADTLVTSKDMPAISKTKGVLRTKIQRYKVTWGLPKYCKVYGDGDSIVAVSTQKRRYTTRVMSCECEVNQPNEENRLNLLANSIEGRTDDTINNKVYKRICDPINLKMAYETISRTKGANNLGIDKVTQDGYSNYTIETISKSLKDHSFKFKPIIKIEIPKKDGTKSIIGIPSPRDNIIQKTAANELENIYEKIFLECSHGFRPKKGTHSALKQIWGWTGIKWFVEGDIKKNFDTINHHRLIEILKEEIKDQEFIEFIWKAIRAKYIKTLSNEADYIETGTPEVDTLSPILSNIYLHKLDKFMQKKVNDSKETGAVSLDNPEYKKIHTKIYNNRQLFSKKYRYNSKLLKSQKERRLDEIQKLEKEQAKYKSKIKREGYRIHYVRYADDFLIGINGPRSLVKKIKNEVHEFLKKELLLELNIEKTKITSAVKSRAKFLGAEIMVSRSRTNDQKRINSSFTKKKRKVSTRNTFGQILIMAPIENIVKKLASQSICKIRNFSKRDVIPKRKTSWINLESFIIIEKYNEIWLGILNYYSFAYNRSQLKFIQYLIQHSAACTLMNKLKLRSRAKIFKKFGDKLTIVIPGTKKSVSFAIEKSLKRINSFKTHIKLPYDIYNFSIRNHKNLL